MIIPNIWKNKIHVPNHQTNELTKHDYFDMKSGSAICSLPSLTQDVGKLNISYKSLVDFNLDIPQNCIGRNGKMIVARNNAWINFCDIFCHIFVIFSDIPGICLVYCCISCLVQHPQTIQNQIITRNPANITHTLDSQQKITHTDFIHLAKCDFSM